MSVRLKRALPGDPQTITVPDFALDMIEGGTDAAAVRTTIGAGTSSVSLPITAADVTGLTSDLAGKQPLDSDLTTIAANITAAGHALLDDANAAAQRTTLSLGNVDNTSDANKPVSTAQQTALDLKANAANPVFTGTVTIPDNALAIADTSGLQSALDAKQATLVSATNIKTVNGSSLLGSGNLAVSAAVTEVEIDVGATPVSEASIAVTDAAITASSKIIGGIAYKAPTGKDLDELDEPLEVKFEPGSGTFNVHIKGLEGYIADKFIVWYMAA